MRAKLRIVSEAASIVLLPAILIICAWFRIGSSSLLIFCAAILSLAMFFACWESSHPTLRQIIPVAVLSALAAAGRVVFAAIPSVQPVTAICIIAGAAFGKREGFMTGSMAAFVSNCFLGQGIWTPWQMYAWGMVGYLAGVIAPLAQKSQNNAIIMVFGFFASFLFSFIMNTWAVVGFYRDMAGLSILAIYSAGFLMDAAHAISTVIFLMLLYPLWNKKLIRIKRKYALGI